MAAPPQIVWHEIGAWRWPSLALIALCFAITPYACSGPPQWRNHGERVLSGGHVRLETRGRFQPGKTLEVRLTLAGGTAEALLVSFNGEVVQRLAPPRLDAAQGGRLRRVADMSLIVPRHGGVFAVSVADVAAPTAAGALWQFVDRPPQQAPRR